MLTDDEIREIEAEAKHYPRHDAVTIDALRIVQRHRGWISDDALRDLAEHLHIAEADLDAVASFYNLIYRRPVGRHVIHLCDGVSCWIMGYRQVRDALRSRLKVDFGETTPDARFTFLPIVCLGVCERAPAMMIDGELHADLDAAQAGRVLEKYA